ncbi:titin homolog [Impatiens glandulifera]|uniref:titin homolog n=1 Tax=Impatiens glandulifera TaxID=253017 RepID=UPI001FB153D0|nr:titin homolog [Impatiens glandulifera]
MLIGLLDGMNVNWAKEIFHNLQDMVKPDSARSWGYAIPLGKIMLHHNKKQPPPGSTGGRKKKSTTEKPAPVKGKSGSKDKQQIESAEPHSETHDEEDSASTSDRTGTQKTDENPSDREGPIEEEQSAISLENTDVGVDGRGEVEVTADNDQKMAEIIVRRILEEIDLRAQVAAEVYREWFGRLKEIEEDVIILTNAENLNEAMDRQTLVVPHARLQKLTVRIRKLSERCVAGTPKAKLQLVVLDKLEIKKGEFTEEIERLEAVHRQQITPHSPALETGDGLNPGNTSPLADPVINETDERTETPFTGPLETDQPGDSEPPITEEKIKTLIKESVKDAVKSWKKKAKRVAVQAFQMAETTRDNLVKAEARITNIEADYQDDMVLHNDHLQQTEDLEDKTSRMVDDMDRFQREIEQQFTKVDEDLGRSSGEVGSTIDRVIALEKKNAGLEERNDKLEADLKAVTEQVTELINAKINADKAVEEANARASKDIQDALDEETRKEKETPRLTEEEIAVREQHLAAKNPALAKSMAAQAAEDAERLNTEKRRLADYAKAHKKTKAASSSSVPAKRKRKTPSRKVQVVGMLERITETVIETQPNPAMHTEDEDEENIEPRSTRQRILNAVPISTVGQP